MSEPADDIEDLLLRSSAEDPVAGEVAALWLEQYQRDTQAVVEQLRRHGRTLAIREGDVAAVRQYAQERLDAARRQLRDRLSRLLIRARLSGRAGR